MAKFSRLLLGGIFSAGVAYLFSRKDVRRRLLGGGQAQLPAAGETPYGPSTATVTPAPAPTVTPQPTAPQAAPAPQAATAQPAATPAAATFTPEATPADLESRIEETRRQVQETLGETAAPEAEEQVAAVTETAADVAETAAAEEAVEEGPVEEGPVQGAPVEEAPVEEAPGAAGLEAIVEESSAIEKQAGEEPVAETEEPAAEEAPELIVEETIEVVEFSDLNTPAEGEPSLEGTGTEPETASKEEAPAPPDEKAAGGPAPSQIDRDEMRRRIDETRARLKAKAFDAMVSGETFIEPEAAESSLEKKHDAGVSVEKDLEDQIDKSLKEQD
ncbi:MAG: hypothetical protein M1539_01040 [Actinobacteria bacterium]|nr:hypothetical protein [Actinomycetota bacterium]MCL5882563.1 hypothetical protein [Actinomycetota bacterium]